MCGLYLPVPASSFRRASGTLVLQAVGRGTLQTAAPELLVPGVARAHRGSDSFSMGAIMWQLATKRKPWDGFPAADLVAEIQCGNRLRLDVLPDDLPSDVRGCLESLLRSCWHGDPAQGPTAPHIKCTLDGIRVALYMTSEEEQAASGVDGQDAEACADVDGGM
jgi:serine/threonine protein kinase